MKTPINECKGCAARDQIIRRLAEEIDRTSRGDKVDAENVVDVILALERSQVDFRDGV